MPPQLSPLKDRAVQLVLTGTHEANGAAEDAGLLANVVHNIWKYVRLERRRQEDDALAARALFTAKKKAKTARMASRAPDPPHLLALSSHGR